MAAIDFNELPDQTAPPEAMVAEPNVLAPTEGPVEEGFDFTGLPDEVQPLQSPKRLPKWDAIKSQLPDDTQDQAIRDSLSLAANYDIDPKTAFPMNEKFKKEMGESSLWDKAHGSLKAGVGDVYATLGNAMKLAGMDEAFSDVYVDFGERMREAFIPPEDISEFTWRKTLDPEWWATTVTRSVPFTVSLVPAAIIGAYGGTAAAGVAGVGAFGTTVMGSIGAAAVSRPMESFFEGGAAYEEALASGRSEAEANSIGWQVAKSNMALVGLDAAQFAVAFTPLRFGQGIKPSLLRRMTAGTGKLSAVAISEAGEERYQEYIQMEALGEEANFFDPDDPRLNEASTIGGIFGMGMGGAGSVWNGMKGAMTKEMPVDVETTFNAAKEGALAEGLSEDDATLKAFDAVSETPEGKAHVEAVMADIQAKASGEVVEEVAPEVAEEAAPTEEEVFERLIQEDLTEEEVGEIFDAFPGGREVLEEQIVSAPVAAIKQRLLDAGMDEVEASSNAVLFDGFRVLAERAGVSAEEFVARYLPQVSREGVAPVEISDEVRAAVSDNAFLRERLTDEVQLADSAQLEATREEITGILEEQKADQTLTGDELAQAKEAVGFLDERIEAVREGVAPIEDTAKVAEMDELEQAAFHGTPHKFDKFTLDHIGKGEGAQAFGWGLYFAESQDVAQFYRETAIDTSKITVKKLPATFFESFDVPTADIKSSAANLMRDEAVSPGTLESLSDDDTFLGILAKAILENNITREEGALVKVELAPAEDEWLDWDKPLNKQSKKVKEALKIAGVTKRYNENLKDFATPQITRGREKRGSNIYAFLEFEQGGDKEASLYLKSIGLPGMKYKDQMSRGKQRGTSNFVVFDEELIQIEEFLQPAQEAIAPGAAPRGRITFAPTGINIELLKDADRSTFLHETGHLYFRVMRDLAVLETATPELKADFVAVMEWLGVTEEQNGEITVEQEEQFARGFEAYLREGKAPTSAMAEAFENFKQWLMQVYRSLLDLNVTLTDDVRGVMNRMLADEGIEAAPAEGVAPEVEAAEFEQAPLEDQRKKDLTDAFGSATFNVGEIERRIKDGLYIHDIPPSEAREKAEGSNIEAASQVARGSLRAVGEEAATDFSSIKNPDKRKAAASKVRIAEATALRIFAEQNDLLLPEFETTLEAEGNRGGTENFVYRDRTTGRWLKANFFQHTPTFADLFDRMMIHNALFESTAYELEGFAEVKGEFLPVFSQPDVTETVDIPAKELQQLAADELESNGFTQETDFPGLVSLSSFKSSEGITVTDIHAGNIINVDGDIAYIDPVISMDAETKNDRLNAAIETTLPEAEVLEQAAPKKPTKKAVKTRVREVTGQKRSPELKKLREEFVAIAKASRAAFREGKNLGAAKEAQKLKRVIARANKVRQVRDYFQLTDAELRSISRKNPLLLSQYEFKLYLDDVRRKAVEITEHSLQKAILMKTIYTKDLGRVDNYRRSLNLPVISKMTTNQLQKFAESLESFHDGDVFLSERELQTVDRTDLAGIRTWREAKERLAAEVGVPVEELEKIKVTEWDEYKWDLALAESNPFYRMLVTETSRKLLEAEMSFHEVENEVFRLARASEKSRNRTFVEKAIPQDPLIMAYIEAPVDERAEIAETMTPEQLDYAHYIQSYFQIALDYLIKTKSLERGRQNYFVHMRKTFLENVKDNGLIRAFKDIFKSYQEDEATFNIMDDDTGNILPLEKFFQFTLRRTGGIDPTTNVTKSFLAYAQMMEKKISLDELIPKMDIYAQSLTPEIYTPRGLEIDRSIKKFVNKFINNKKGRRIRWIAKQGGTIDVSIRGLRTFTTVIDLGFNIPSGIAAFVGEQATNFQMLGTRGYTKGTTRIKTKQGKKILEKYEAFIGRSSWEEFTAPGKIITERIGDGIFGLFHEASVLANKQFLLGAITQEEFDTGEITSERLAILRTEMGRFRVVPGAKSLVGSTSAGSAMVQYKTWAAPIIRTLSKDLLTYAKDVLGKKPIGEALTTKEARELYRFIGLTTTAVIVGSMAAAEDDDESFTGQVLKRVYRESMTLLQGVDPSLWLATPRMMGFITQLGKNLKAIATLEEYKTKPGLKGIDGLQRQLIPRAVRQFETKEEARGR